VSLRRLGLLRSLRSQQLLPWQLSQLLRQAKQQ
jgi:hypothetical protein